MTEILAHQCASSPFTVKSWGGGEDLYVQMKEKSALLGRAVLWGRAM